jgi:hypothetical protein
MLSTLIEDLTGTDMGTNGNGLRVLQQIKYPFTRQAVG